MKQRCLKYGDRHSALVSFGCCGTWLLGWEAATSGRQIIAGIYVRGALSR